MGLRFVALAVVGLLAAGCSGDTGSRFGSGAPAASNANVAEAARLKLTDRCMLEPSSGPSVDPKKGKAPFCQCYAKVVVQGLSPQQQTAVAASGSMPLSVDNAAVAKSCSRA